MKETIYIDAAATSLKPKSVIDAQKDFLQNHYANAGRGICARANYVDEMVANSRQKTADFIGAKSPNQIIFTSGTTDGMNRIVNILKGSLAFDENSTVIVSNLDHHSARMPWQEQAHLNNCKLKICNLDNNFNLDLSDTDYFDIFVITAMSNVLGAPQDVPGLIRTAKKINPNVITIVDCAQYVAHLPIGAEKWGCDFLCFSGHKMGADTGLGIMYIKEPDRWAIDKFGGGMVAKTDDNYWTPAVSPDKYEAGTLPLTQIAGLSHAIDYLVGHADNHNLIKYLYNELSKIEKIKILTKPDAYVLTFAIDDMHPLDFGALMGAHNICLRVGNMCASWIFQVLNRPYAIRISTGSWNTMDEMADVVSIIKKILGG